MRSEAKTTDSGRADGRTTALLILGVVGLGYLVPGGGLLVAVAAHFTAVRNVRGVMVALWVIAGIMTLIPLVTIIGLGIAPVATVGPETSVS